jgi:hypothetical protein
VGMTMTLNCPTQNRFQQDVFVSHMILQSLEELAKQQDKKKEESNTKKNTTNGEDTPLVIKPEEFDGITITEWTTNSLKKKDEGAYDKDDDDPVKTSAHRILSGEVEAVLLLPKKQQPTKNNKHIASAASASDCSFLEPLLYPVLPENCLIFPGSFNPPHQGHIALAQAAASKLGGEGDPSSSDTESESSAPPPVVFEISITNADKPAMAPEEVARRVAQFQTLLLSSQDEEKEEEATLPQWGNFTHQCPLVCR